MSSSPKEIIFEAEARELLYAGIKKLANVVAFTLGPRGRNVGLEKSWGAPTITNDGNSIVKDVILENEYENMGVAIAKEAVQKIKDKCGDGTTTTTILLKSIVENGIKQIAAGASPINIKRGIDKSIAFAIEEIKKSSIAIKDSKEIRNIAIVSASGDQEIGNMIADAMEKVGKSGVITIEEAKGTETTVEVVEGMQFDRGYISAYFCTNMDKGIAELSNPKILLVDKKISNIHEILPILSPIATQGAELLIIAEDIDGDALTTLVINKLRGTLKVVAVKAPGFGDRRKAMLQDIAVLTGGAVVSEETGLNLNEIPLDMLGSAERIIVSKEYTTIVNGHGQSEEIKARIKQLEHEISANSSSYDKEKLE
ncbi:MAG: molecular chaperone GroEL, partial [Chlamydia sp. 32-24]